MSSAGFNVEKRGIEKKGGKLKGKKPHDQRSQKAEKRAKENTDQPLLDPGTEAPPPYLGPSNFEAPNGYGDFHGLPSSQQTTYPIPTYPAPHGMPSEHPTANHVAPGQHIYPTLGESSDTSFKMTPWYPPGSRLAPGQISTVTNGLPMIESPEVPAAHDWSRHLAYGQASSSHDASPSFRHPGNTAGYGAGSPRLFHPASSAEADINGSGFPDAVEHDTDNGIASGGMSYLHAGQHAHASSMPAGRHWGINHVSGQPSAVDRSYHMAGERSWDSRHGYQRQGCMYRGYSPASQPQAPNQSTLGYSSPMINHTHCSRPPSVTEKRKMSLHGLPSPVLPAQSQSATSPIEDVNGYGAQGGHSGSYNNGGYSQAYSAAYHTQSGYQEPLHDAFRTRAFETAYGRSHSVHEEQVQNTPSPQSAYEEPSHDAYRVQTSLQGHDEQERNTPSNQVAHNGSSYGTYGGQTSLNGHDEQARSTTSTQAAHGESSYSASYHGHASLRGYEEQGQNTPSISAAYGEPSRSAYHRQNSLLGYNGSYGGPRQEQAAHVVYNASLYSGYHGQAAGTNLHAEGDEEDDEDSLFVRQAPEANVDH